MLIYMNGLLLGLSLIMALGPQNIFLIRQGSKRNHAVLSAITCFLCDMALIVASVVGLRDVLESHPSFRGWMTWFGVIFLLYYGLSALRRGFRAHSSSGINEQPHATRGQIILLALSFSLLNPHAIIDSLVLIGGGSSQFPGYERLFLFGVISSSLLWFSALTFSAYYFSNTLTRTTVWQRVELGSGILMLFLSLKLAYGQF